MDVIFNFSRYEELRQSVVQLVRENLDPDLLQEEAHDLFESWWADDASSGLTHSRAGGREGRSA